MGEEPHEGINPEKQYINKMVDLKCPSCGHLNVLWLERICVDGSLDFYYLVHTEVNDVYVCPKCNHKWQVFGFM